jgi:hypothetical protein
MAYWGGGGGSCAQNKNNSDSIWILYIWGVNKWTDVTWLQIRTHVTRVMKVPATKYVEKFREMLSDCQLLKTYSDQRTFLSVEW